MPWATTSATKRAATLQMHGGMGMTDELAVGHCMKRLMVIDSSFGDATWQRQKFVALANA